ncbi:MAG: fasciclin domain-containing protein, partial [Mariniphaga sp.]|nr:fasciclin domain-containing protein [Mariniphaga sp.]
YNPEGNDYTLFLPDNDAIDRYIQNSNQFNSLDELLNDRGFAGIFSRYHVINQSYEANEFPFGAFSEPTLSNDFLAVSFVIEEDSAYYKINNQAPVILTDIETTNGYVHIISEALIPVTTTSYDWLQLNDGFSIFKSAVDATGFKDIIDINIKDEELKLQPISMLIEHDSIFNKNEIYSFDDLASVISPDDNDYTNVINPLYNFVGYHVLSGNLYLDDFEGVSTNYSTMSDIPVNINGTGIDLKINRGKTVFDTIISGTDTTLIDFIGFNYDNSNIITQSGAIHFINRIMKQVSPSRATRTYQFHEELYINELKQEIGSFIIEDHSDLNRITWDEPDLLFVQMAEASGTAWSDDYLQISGDFEMTYIIPKIVQGKYTVYLGAESFNRNNALVEVFIDGKKIGGLVDLSFGGTAGNPFARIELGTIDFIKYSEHIVEIKALIPGSFLWDYIQFEPY